MDDKTGALSKLKAIIADKEKVNMSSIKVGDIIYVPLDEEDGLTLKEGYKERRKYIVIIGFTPEGIAVLDTELADSIKMLNDSGIITAVYKDNPQIAIHPQQDWLIDTMLVRDGDGAFLNTRFGEEQVEEFNAQMAERNVAPQNIVQVDIMPKGCLLSHMDGTRQMFGDAETAMKDILGTHSIQDFGGQGDDE